jgi:hypothetical protein
VRRRRNGRTARTPRLSNTPKYLSTRHMVGLVDTLTGLLQFRTRRAGRTYRACEADTTVGGVAASGRTPPQDLWWQKTSRGTRRSQSSSDASSDYPIRVSGRCCARKAGSRRTRVIFGETVFCSRKHTSIFVMPGYVIVYIALQQPTNRSL